MKLFELRSNYTGFVSFLFKDLVEDHKWDYPLFSGDPAKGPYPVPSGVRNLENGPPYPQILPDFTNLGLSPIPTFSEHAISALGELLEHGELAPIKLDEPMEYFGFNATAIVDILDESRSQIVRFSSGRVMSVSQYMLATSVKQLPPIFKIPQTRRNTTYVNEAFVMRVEEAGLTGFKFNLLWNDSSLGLKSA